MDDDALGELLDALEIGLELNSAGPAIEPLLEALIGGAPQSSLQQAVDAAVEALWDTALEAEVRSELEAFRVRAVDEDMRVVPTIDVALAELRAPARHNHVAHALVWRAASKLMRRATRNQERMAELERTLETAPQRQHRRLTLPIAAAASLAADVGDEEAAKEVATYAFAVAPGRRPSRRQHDRATARLARALASDERRVDVRAALAELAQLSAADFPLASSALRSLLAEPVPDDPAQDEVWVSLVVGLAHEQLEDALGAPLAR